MGELCLTPEQFGSYTILELDAMFDGYVRRQERLEDLFIINCALPTYRAAYRRKAPTYKNLTAHRVKHNKVGEIDEDTQNQWRDFLKGGTANAQKHGDQAGD